MQEFIDKLKEWFLHKFEVHCIDCEKLKQCPNCEKLYMLLEQERNDKKQLLEMVYGSRDVVTLSGEVNEFKPVPSSYTSPSRRMRELERASRVAADKLKDSPIVQE